MTFESLVKIFENKAAALKAKQQASVMKGSTALYDLFEKEYLDTVEILDRLKVAGIDRYTPKSFKEKLEAEVLANLPRLTFYFRKRSIEAAIKQALEKALEVMWVG